MSEQQVLPEAEVTFADLGAALRAQAAGAAEQARRNLDLVEGIREVGAKNAALRASLAQSEAERERLQGELFEMCKLCHRYQNELWSDAKVAADPSNPLRAELAREREFNQGLRHTNDTLTGVIAIQVEKIAKLQLEDKAKPVATPKEAE